jgi:hypothetical protein
VLGAAAKSLATRSVRSAQPVPGPSRRVSGKTGMNSTVPSMLRVAYTCSENPPTRWGSGARSTTIRGLPRMGAKRDPHRDARRPTPRPAKRLQSSAIPSAGPCASHPTAVDERLLADEIPCRSPSNFQQQLDAFRQRLDRFLYRLECQQNCSKQPYSHPHSAYTDDQIDTMPLDAGSCDP